MNILILAPHPDDETIGCGGTLCLHAARGDYVSAVFLTSGELGLKHLPKKEAWAIRESEARSVGDTGYGGGVTDVFHPAAAPHDEFLPPHSSHGINAYDSRR